MWFQFTTTAEYDHYTITVNHEHCNSPAGLQALLIRADDCDARNFFYAGCSNLITTDSIKLFLRDTIPGRHYFIYIDGYDGTICNYTLSIWGKNSESVTIDDFRFIKFDYDTRNVPSFDPPDLKTDMINNSVVIRWMGSNEEDVSFYAVEALPRWYSPGSEEFAYAQVMGIVPSRGLVSGGPVEYSYTLYPTSDAERDYCYRLVKVSSKGEKSFTKPFCIHLVPIKSFYVDEVVRSSVPDEYTVKYLNHVKKEDFSVEVLDESMNPVKQMQLLDEPVRDGTITIRMNGFDHGRYYFRMTNRAKEMYVRMFDVF